MEISRELANRFKTIHRFQAINYIKQIGAIEQMFLQYQIDKETFAKYGENGKMIGGVDLNWEDIYTEGRRFYKIIEDDPSF